MHPRVAKTVASVAREPPPGRAAGRGAGRGRARQPCIFIQNSHSRKTQTTWALGVTIHTVCLLEMQVWMRKIS
eukprot:COSAG02_NODE_11041_length_1806_cov_3.099004_1_plen_72_part_10